MAARRDARNYFAAQWACGSLIDSLGGGAIKPTTSESSSHIPCTVQILKLECPPPFFSTLLIPRLCLVLWSDAPTRCPQINCPGSLSARTRRVGSSPMHPSTPSPAQCENSGCCSLSACPQYPISMGHSGGVDGPVGATGPLCPSRKLGKTEKHSSKGEGGGIRLVYEDMPESGDGSGQNRGMVKALTMIVNRKTNDASLSRHHFSSFSDSARQHDPSIFPSTSTRPGMHFPSHNLSPAPSMVQEQCLLPWRVGDGCAVGRTLAHLHFFFSCRCTTQEAMPFYTLSSKGWCQPVRGTQSWPAAHAQRGGD